MLLRDVSVVALEMSRIASERDSKVYVYNTDTYDRNESYDIFRLINFEETDGLVIYASSIKIPEAIQFLIKKAKEHNVTVVCMDGHIDGCVNIEYEYGDAFSKIVRHIIEKHGCRRLCMMAGIEGNSFSQERIDAFHSVLDEYGIPFEPDKIYYGNFWRDPTLRAMEKMYSDGELPEAIICANDASAIAVCEFLNKHGLRVPEDVLVTGLDGIYEGKTNYPTITTAEQDITSACEKAVDRVFSEGTGGDCLIPFAISYCQSCGCKSTGQFDRNDAIVALNEELSGSYGFDDYIVEFGKNMLTSRNLEQSMEIVGEFSFDTSLVCINESFFDFSRDLSCDIERPFDDRLVIVSHKRGETQFLGETVKFGEIIPDVSDDEDLKNQCYMLNAVKFGNITIGYVAISLFIERRYYRHFNKYIRMLSQSLTMLH